jgi:hypothetical protein
VRGKRIPNCLGRSTTGSYPNYQVSCLWRPANIGFQSIMVSLTPSDNALSSVNSVSSTYLVTKRGSFR